MLLKTRKVSKEISLGQNGKYNVLYLYSVKEPEQIKMRTVCLKMQNSTKYIIQHKSYISILFKYSYA